jgi:hypothetical protein
VLLGLIAAKLMVFITLHNLVVVGVVFASCIIFGCVTADCSLILDWANLLIADASKRFVSPIVLLSVHVYPRLLISRQVPGSTRLMPLHIGTSIAPCLYMRCSRLSLLQCLRCPNLCHASI